MKGVTAASPINDWTMLHVWLYLEASGRADLANEAYFEGLDRIGCYMCPACRIAEFEIVKRMHPDMWAEWEEALSKWARERSLPESWLKYHLWRWVKFPLKVAGFASTVGLEKDAVERAGQRIGPRLIQVKYEGATAEAVFGAKIPLGILEAISPPVGEAKVGGAIVEIDGGYFRAQVSEEGFAYIEASGEAEVRPALVTVAKLIARSLLCRGCGSCASWCPTGAASLILGRPVIDKRLCVRCGRCVEKCPVTVFYAPLLARDLAQLTSGSCSSA